MDFRTCPACKASVLEDDVTECPFCGASMNGKPAAKAPAPAAKAASPGKPGAPAAKPGAAPSKAATPEPAKPAPGARPPAGGPRPPMGAGGRPGGGGRGNTVADEENPFDMDMSELQKAVAVSPKETKQRTLEVKCPMCETVGYVAPQHQGKTAKCANPDCKHPYFTVPLPKKEAVTTGLKPKSKFTVGHVVAIVVVCIGLLGGLLWRFVYHRDSGQGGPVAGGPKLPPPPPPPPTDNDKPKEPEVKRTSLVEIQKGAITELVRVASTPDTNQSRAIRFLAESYAVTGQAPLAMTELGKLAQKSPDAPYLQVEPLVRLYLQARKSGAADAGKYLDQALKAIEKLPDTGRGPLDAVTALAAALVLDNRMPEAVKLISEISDEKQAADYSMLWTAAVYGNAFDFQVLSEIPAWLAAPAPQHQAVTWILSAWGESEKSLAWVKTAGTDESIDASLAVWAAHLGQSVASTSEGV
ncbi:MAG TPA: hypothetical protein VM510_12985, partial [Caulifigura sp.]|nr:hypothetical protein [Caulifigura sp.]